MLYPAELRGLAVRSFNQITERPVNAFDGPQRNLIPCAAARRGIIYPPIAYAKQRVNTPLSLSNRETDRKMALEKTENPAKSVRLARTQDEIEQAQRLRYQVFYEEYDAIPTKEMMQLRRDMDDLDAVADHLIVIDNSTGKDVIVGTYRL